MARGSPAHGGCGRGSQEPAAVAGAAQPLPGSVRRQAREEAPPTPTPPPHVPRYAWHPHAVLPAHAASRGPGCPLRRLPGQPPRALPGDWDPLSRPWRRAVSPGPGAQPRTGKHACARRCLQLTHAPRLLASFATSIKDEKSHSWAGSQSQPIFFFLFFFKHTPPTPAGTRLPSAPRHPRSQAAASEGPWPLRPVGMGRVGTSPVLQRGWDGLLHGHCRQEETWPRWCHAEGTGDWGTLQPLARAWLQGSTHGRPRTRAALGTLGPAHPSRPKDRSDLVSF